MLEQTITLGTEDQLQQAMVGVLDDQYCNQYIYPVIAKKLAGCELLPAGVNMAYEFAVYDAMKARELPGQVAMAFSLFKDKLIAAIIHANDPAIDKS